MTQLYRDACESLIGRELRGKIQKCTTTNQNTTQISEELCHQHEIFEVESVTSVINGATSNFSFTNKSSFFGDTFVSCCHCRKEDNKERCGIFSGIGDVWKFLFGIIVSAKTLCKAPPGRKASNQRSQSVKFATTLITIQKRKKNISET